jgi:ribonuclease HI
MSTLIWTGGFDGGSRGNPGIGGAGWWVRDAIGSLVACGTVNCGDHATNNEAEYCGLLALLEFVRSDPRVPPDVSLKVQGDSKLVVEQIKYREGTRGVGWRCNAIGLRPLLAQVQATLAALPHPSVMVYHIPREFNKDADAMADHAIHTRATAIGGIELLNAARSGPGKTTVKGAANKPSCTAPAHCVSAPPPTTPARPPTTPARPPTTPARPPTTPALLPTTPARPPSPSPTRACRIKIRPGAAFDVWIGHDYFERGYELIGVGWGNPIRQMGKKQSNGRGGYRTAPTKAAEKRVHAYRRWLTHDQPTLLRRLANGELQDKILGCFCDLDYPCHGDVLLEIGNRPEMARAMLDALQQKQKDQLLLHT